VPSSPVGIACGRERRWAWRLTDVSEDALDGRGLGDERDDAPIRPAVGTDQGQRLEQPGLRSDRGNMAQRVRAGERVLEACVGGGELTAVGAPVASATLTSRSVAFGRFSTLDGALADRPIGHPP
jgi:hypothetical protein